MAKQIKFATLGSVSEGTLRTEDLVQAFADELEYHVRQNAGRHGLDLPAKRKLIAAARRFDADAEDADECMGMLDELIDHLGTFAPPYAYFGALEGDGADFGFWPEYGACLSTCDLPTFDHAPPDGFRGDCLIVSDHGTVTCGHVNGRGKFIEYWSIV